MLKGFLQENCLFPNKIILKRSTLYVGGTNLHGLQTFLQILIFSLGKQSPLLPNPWEPQEDILLPFTVAQMIPCCTEIKRHQLYMSCVYLEIANGKQNVLICHWKSSTQPCLPTERASWEMMLTLVWASSSNEQLPAGQL